MSPLQKRGKKQIACEFELQTLKNNCTAAHRLQMATATVPYGTAQPAVNLYQNAPSGLSAYPVVWKPSETDRAIQAEYHALKRLYLGLLPPQQIIEICLTFEVHVPFHVRASVWPSDLKAAIAAMQGQSQPPLAAPNTNPSNDASSVTPRTADHPLTTSLRDSSQAVPPAKPPDTTSRPEQPSSSPGPPSVSAQTSNTTALTNPPAPITQSPYTHQPYGFLQQQASYPHAPYYSAPPAGYSYPHSPYPPYPPTSYPQNANTSSTPLPQTVEAQLSAEDLPSYEDIIVEALMGCPDPEGSVPKNIFTWMSSHYPLQSNFRPSASQALQKAYKRGRFEKSSNGKYRLNPLWEGGSVSPRLLLFTPCLPLLNSNS